MTQNVLSAPYAPRRSRYADRLFWTTLGRESLALLRLWRRRSRTRRQLARLDARLLDDVGLDPATAEREAALPFWQASKAETR